MSAEKWGTPHLRRSLGLGHAKDFLALQHVPEGTTYVLARVAALKILDMNARWFTFLYVDSLGCTVLHVFLHLLSGMAGMQGQSLQPICYCQSSTSYCA